MIKITEDKELTGSVYTKRITKHYFLGILFKIEISNIKLLAD